jgi:hypothetical protein
LESLTFLTNKLNVFQKNFEIKNSQLDVSKISSFKNENIDFISKNGSNNIASKVKKKLIYFLLNFLLLNFFA